uniref:Uncharacterized protein n=1 Tax=Eucampia antarctica TaxID=49252 RepID=A0A7S2R383_9STRA|mmetsp:Transcript_15502/g.14917  ORF Transcript_15502/g.14917 Transcript_15502/m.14917 type:complete len:146 (+) Transcript_15502:33-470(+)|eukprot:CAMPEP_0197824040 /NCGR_PEP_ID=MMETSP1437-20131217/1359_1 /TAXON_ID=49252 ORGANISM="Eucampia antarctica, Strain CCMP1452" /NCGR_SAMPLE_ID=MMETSP1437 /ASSEMBLY_ACC=CAM_ASM_001096 /LENGTH=145 /DNA_ID=CAMNT_0043423519 /DNA_START=32 /DNA_END=469 /DNA_ORIENTATION=+
MKMHSSSVLFVAIAFVIHHAAAFAPMNQNKCSSTNTCQLFAERRAFLNTAVVSLIGSGFATIGGPVWADDDVVDDLAMPAQEEQKALDEAAIAERLRRKAELQKKAAKPVNFKESLKAEKEKQNELKMTQTEKRNAMCEELGRGC